MCFCIFSLNVLFLFLFLIPNCQSQDSPLLYEILHVLAKAKASSTELDRVSIDSGVVASLMVACWAHSSSPTRYCPVPWGLAALRVSLSLSVPSERGSCVTRAPFIWAWLGGGRAVASSSGWEGVLSGFFVSRAFLQHSGFVCLFVCLYPPSPDIHFMVVLMFSSSSLLLTCMCPPRLRVFMCSCVQVSFDLFIWNRVV